MALSLRRKRRTAGDGEAAPRSRSLLAAALPLEGKAGKQAWMNSAGDSNWQRQAWYYYDSIGELRFAFNTLANAVSRATLFAAELDPETGLITGPTEDRTAQAVAAQVLGGMEDRPQNQSTMALHWQVAGETYVLILPQTGGEPDRWAVVSRTGMRQGGGSWQFKDPLTGVWTRLGPNDRVVRIWCPHPDEPTHADSAMRPGIPICSEVEKCSQNITAKLNSRIASNGLFFLPQEIDFSTGDGEEANAQSFMKLLMEVMEANIAEPGTAAAQVPLMADVPGEVIAQLADGHIDLSTTLDGMVGEMREQALSRLGRTVDMPREVAMGETGAANHWSAWQVEETTYKIHVEPFLLKLAMALTKEYFRPVLKAMGVADPSRFVLAWDVTEIVSRPDDSEDVKYAFEHNLVSVDWVLSKLGIPDDARPSDEEAKFNLAKQLVLSAPTTLENASVAELLGFEPTVPAGGGQSFGEPQGGDEPAGPRALPQRAGEPASVAASAVRPGLDSGLVVAAELAVFDALSRAGGRLLTRRYRDQCTSTPKWELHTVIPVDGRGDELMEGSFQFVDNIAAGFEVDSARLRSGLQDYVSNRLQFGAVHEREILARYLQGALDDHAR